jgi:elongation factor G
LAAQGGAAAFHPRTVVRFPRDVMNLSQLRNIGISAHIDSGKTTLSERILFYSGRIHKMQEVKGGEGGATMDHMELERERGITITSAATTVEWNDHQINLIDTPGHVDFTVEVERSLRVLDGAILVLCAVGGVQSQSLTVDRQMKRYHVPRLAFINKMDRMGADPHRVCDQIRERLGADAILMQWPIGAGENFEGLINLITMQAVYFDGDNGENVRREAIPAELQKTAAQARRQMLEALTMYDDHLMELLLSEQEPPEELVHRVVRDAVQQQECTPVFLGTAYRNKGVQPLLDAVVRYLPSPLDREIRARKHSDPETLFPLAPNANQPLVAMAFKIVDDPYGQLTFMRIYQGTIAKGQFYFNQRTSRKERFSRVVRMHADKREEIESASAGDIVAVMGVDCASGDTYAAEPKYCSLESMFVPQPVIKVAVSPLARDGGDKLGKALARFRKEDPTFQVMTDPETGETLIAGMGELHLEIYVERIRREYGVELEVGRPKVSYREAPTQPCNFDYRHRKQTGGSGQYAHIIGRFEPLPEKGAAGIPAEEPEKRTKAGKRRAPAVDALTEEPSSEHAEEVFVFEDEVVGGRVPREYIPSVEKGFRDMLLKGPLAGYPVVGLKATLLDGSYHEVDSSDMAFQICARDCFREFFPKTKPVLLEPIMKLEVECPGQFQGSVSGNIISRRGLIICTDMRDGVATITSEVPLAETFGYATDLRSQTQGQGTFTMELARYRRVPTLIQQEIIEEKKKGQLVGAR